MSSVRGCRRDRILPAAVSGASWPTLWVSRVHHLCRIGEDDYFLIHKLYPNVDFYSGIIYQAMGFPVEMFPVLFAIGRTAGWLAQWEEGILDREQKITRPGQLYSGAPERHLNLPRIDSRRVCRIPSHASV